MASTAHSGRAYRRGRTGRLYYKARAEDMVDISDYSALEREHKMPNSAQSASISDGISIKREQMRNSVASEVEDNLSLPNTKAGSISSVSSVSNTIRTYSSAWSRHNSVFPQGGDVLPFNSEHSSHRSTEDTFDTRSSSSRQLSLESIATYFRSTQARSGAPPPSSIGTSRRNDAPPPYFQRSPSRSIDNSSHGESVVGRTSLYVQITEHVHITTIHDIDQSQRHTYQVCTGRSSRSGIWKSLVGLLSTAIAMYIAWCHVNGPEFAFLRQRRIDSLGLT